MIDAHAPILVVDDVGPSRQAVVNVLDVLGFSHILEAANGAEAWQLMRDGQDQLGLVISDWKMPRMSGIELLKRVRTHASLCEIPFLLFTSKVEPGDLALAADMGVSGYLVKPLDISVLQHKLYILSREVSTRGNTAVLTLETLVREGRLPEARELVVRMIRSAGEEPDSFSLYGQALLARLDGDLERAGTLIDACLRHAPLMGRAWLLRARILHEAGDMDQARSSVDKAMQLSPDNVEYVLFRGKLELDDHNIPQSRLFFMTALNMAPGDDKVREKVWRMHIEADQVHEAMQEFGPYLWAFLSSEVLNDTALALRKKGKTEVAVRVYREALRKDPANTRLLFNLAMAEVRLSDTRNALKHLQRVVDMDPDFHAAHNVLDKMRSRNKKPL
ncbi:response regulator [Desulfoplanes formicivorans]|uniref:Response regulatory domain-containing protein n=1 Tax=Desulfoplanes formicivorans TaxID=1592317 RepID=A0A194AID7_9BACT|nr:response regulator [Desulfoplanes formicivorans]GAU08836.1 hypothetical protein DPF_1553 [Desulfoplanes formicivorans]